MSALTIPPKDSPAGQMLLENTEAAKRFAREVAKAEQRLGDRLPVDSATGKHVLTSDDVKFLIAFNEKVKEATGTNFIDFNGLMIACAKEAHDAREAKRRADAGIADA